MSSEYYLSRREFNKRIILSGAAVVAGATDFSYMSHQNNEAKKEVEEQGITPPSQANKTLQTKEEKAQQGRFDKAVDEHFHEKTSLYKLRVGVDSLAFGGGLLVVFDTIFREAP